MKRARIAGIGRGVPQKVLTNAQLAEMVDTSDAWIVERTGIRERHLAGANEVTSDMAAEAALMACEMASVKPAQLDAIVLGTVTPDMPMPATAAYVQHKIGAGTCPAFDISAACAGFLFGLAIAEGFICRGTFQRVLVVGVELLSRVLDWEDRNTCVLFGDGAGAAVVVPADDNEDHGILDVEIHTDGAHAADLAIPGGGSVHPVSPESIGQNLHVVHMNGKAIFTQAVRNMSSASKSVLQRCGLEPGDITTVFAHQANQRILEGVSKRTHIPLERFFINIERYGNTSSASIPIAMSEALEQGRVSEGDLLLLTALGAGVSWSSAVIRW